MGEYAKITNILRKMVVPRTDYLRKTEPLSKVIFNSIDKGSDLSIDIKLHVNRNRIGKAQKSKKKQTFSKFTANISFRLKE